MKLTRLSRLLAALVTIFSLLFTQLAVAGYDCPDLAPAPVAMVGCTGMDAAQPILCTAHCDAGHQSLDTPAAPQVQPFIASALACIVADFVLADTFPGAQHASTPLPQATSPPIGLRNCCFRI